MSYALDDTIVSIATPQGHGGIGVIRLSGPESLKIAGEIFVSGSVISFLDVTANTLHHGFIKNKSTTLDEVVVSVFKKPNSYTGEDVIEISCHGGPLILANILELCLSRGARHAKPGEFTFRAFLNGKMDLSRAEAVCDAIQSKTNLELSSAMEKLTGGFLKKINAWRKSLLNCVSALEAQLDHSEEELGPPEDFEISLTSLLDDIRPLIASSNKYGLLKHGIQAVIAGKPNTGKSSLLNALLERDRAIVTDIPGTTRDIIEELLDVKGLPVVITDTAGLRQKTGDPVEKIGQERSLETLCKADIVFLVFDSSRQLDEDDLHVTGLLRTLKASVAAVLNKSDLPPAVKPADIKVLLPGAEVFSVSALKNTGLAGLEEYMVAWFKEKEPAGGSSLTVNLRQRQALEKAEESLAAALESFRQKDFEEITAVHLREALSALGEITGETTPDEILDVIFSKFCVGK